ADAQLGQVRERCGLVLQLLDVVLAELALAHCVRSTQCKRPVALADRDQLHLRGIAACAGAGACDARVHFGQVARDVGVRRGAHGHAPTTPASIRSSSVSQAGKPTTFEYDPEIARTSPAPSPWTAYEPAF